jgi:hypothetical protein
MFFTVTNCNYHIFRSLGVFKNLQEFADKPVNEWIYPNSCSSELFSYQTFVAVYLGYMYHVNISPTIYNVRPPR